MSIRHTRAVLLAVATTVGLGGVVLAAPPTAKVEADLAASTVRYFSVRNLSWVTPDPVKGGAAVADENAAATADPATAAVLTAKLTERREDRRALAADGISWKNATTTTNIESTTIKADTATVRAQVAVTLQPTNVSPGQPSESSYSDEHLITYQRGTEGWQMVSDTVLDAPADPSEVPLAVDAATPPSATDRPATPAPAPPKTETPGMGAVDAYAVPMGRPSGLNYRAMADYAIRWANGYNPDYPQYGNDCTNFVSQALLAGGWKIEGANSLQIWSTDKWDDNAAGIAGATRTWTAASYLLAFSTRRTDWMNNIWNAGLGDLLFTDWDPNDKPDGHVDHVMIVTSIVKGEPYISQHTNARRNIPLSMSITLARQDGKYNIVWYGRRT